MDWDTLASGLADELPDLEAGTLVVITEPGEDGLTRYAQFAQDRAVLRAEVIADHFLDESVRATKDGRRAIAGAGWNPPDPDAGHHNWWYTLSWPATSQRYRDLSGMTVRALRDGYGIGDASVLVYQAWNSDTNVPTDLPRLGLPYWR